MAASPSCCLSFLLLGVVLLACSCYTFFLPLLFLMWPSPLLQKKAEPLLSCVSLLTYVEVQNYIVCGIKMLACISIDFSCSGNERNHTIYVQTRMDLNDHHWWSRGRIFITIPLHTAPSSGAVKKANWRSLELLSSELLKSRPENKADSVCLINPWCIQISCVCVCVTQIPFHLGRIHQHRRR